jgi:hypothetical protein
MKLHEAIYLVRQKYLEELKGVTSGSITDQYKDACRDYPVITTIAHLLLASKLDIKPSYE